MEVKNILIINKLIINTMNEEQKEILGKIKVLLEELESNNSSNTFIFPNTYNFVSSLYGLGFSSKRV